MMVPTGWPYIMVGELKSCAPSGNVQDQEREFVFLFLFCFSLFRCVFFSQKWD